jgi:hypothetical protein
MELAKSNSADLTEDGFEDSRAVFNTPLKNYCKIMNRKIDAQ